MRHAHLSLTGLLATAFFFQEIDKVASNCPNGWMTYQSQCYGLFTRKVSWMEAEKACQSYGSSGHLVSITSEMQNMMISMYINYNFSDDEGIWIGLFDPNQTRSWQWPDRSSPAYLPWDSGKPSVKGQKACVHLSSKSGFVKWSDAPCSAQMSYLCKLGLY